MWLSAGIKCEVGPEQAGSLTSEVPESGGRDVPDVATNAPASGYRYRANARAVADSCGVQVIVYASLRAWRARGRLVLLCGLSRLQRLLELTGAGDLVEIVDLTPGEPAVQFLMQLAREDQAA